MIIHIIRPNETIYDVSKRYNLTVDEIKNANAHFRSWENLAPGAKIKLPEISEAVSEELDFIEPFIEDYYPKIETMDNLERPMTNETPKQTNINKSKKKYNYYPYYGYYHYPYYKK